ncbi:unnamed protein product [Larinioides sclopetarius]|uniref:Potassium channel domain-containing protein n=1 Tax=Larinioides sclopetarius TaxID=280406 RepID=A0AAV2B968_9ARAC
MMKAIYLERVPTQWAMINFFLIFMRGKSTTPCSLDYGVEASSHTVKRIMPMLIQSPFRDVLLMGGSRGEFPLPFDPEAESGKLCGNAIVVEFPFREPCSTSKSTKDLPRYGNIAPRTNWGKIATIIYAIIGIPLMLLYLTNIGDILAKSFRYVYGRICSCGSSDPYKRRRHNNHHHHPSENYRVHHIVAHNSPKRHHPNSEPGVQDKLHMPPEDEVRIENMADLDLDIEYEKPRVSVPITLCLLILVSYISGGAVLFSLWEGWGFLDGSYFCFVTLSTIGFGDLVPGDSVVSDEGTQEKLVICSLYLLIGMALIAMCFNLMQEEVIHKVRNCGRRIGIIKDQEEEDDMG